MSTSGGTILNGIAYVVVLIVSVGATSAVLGDLGRVLRAPRVAAVALWAVVAVPSLVELAYHPIYDALSRQPDAIARGEVWRLVTSVVVQDGGLGGTLSNLVELAVIAVVAVQLWGAGRAVGLFLVGALLMNAVAYGEAGGGNSGATFFLATSMAGLLIVRRPSRQVVLCAAAIVVIGLGAALLLSDAHGVPILGGLVVGAALAAAVPPRETSGRPSRGTGNPLRTSPGRRVTPSPDGERVDPNAVSFMRRGRARVPPACRSPRR